MQVEIIPEIGHEHGIHDETWKYDKTQHWQECSCGEKLNVANHTYGDWKVTKEATIVCEDKITADTETKIIALIDEITEELILPKREKEAV